MKKDEFWKHVDKSGGADACWEWQMSRQSNGYGQLWTMDARKPCRYLAHRLAYELTNGAIPDGLLVMHSCDNPPCCNPSHLTTGTNADNSKDASAKGRLLRSVTVKQAITAKEMLQSCADPKVICKTVGIDLSTLDSIRRGGMARHIGPDCSLLPKRIYYAEVGRQLHLSRERIRQLVDNGKMRIEQTDGQVKVYRNNALILSFLPHGVWRHRGEDLFNEVTHV